MKNILRTKSSFFIFTLIMFGFFSVGVQAQTQIGADIDGEAADDQSGSSVSISSDGTRVAIGAPFNGGGGFQAGQVRVYESNGGVWTQMGADIDGEAVVDQSGASISISSDGTRVAIGARLNDDAGSNAGHVRVYEFNGGVWTQMGADIDGAIASGQFGSSVSISSDGTRVAIGEPINSDGGNFAGQVRVYEFNGGAWTQMGAGINGEAASDRSGSSVSISSDGTRVAIGARFNGGGGNAAGHVRVYEFNGGVWTQMGADIDGEAASDQSSFSLSISSDGTRVAIGAIGNDDAGSAAGHVRVYEFNGGVWTQMGADIDGEAAGDQSGFSVSISSDGTRVAIGARFNGLGGSSAGHVRVYEFNGGVWTQTGADIDGEAVGDRLGSSVSISSDGTRVAIGAPFNNDEGNSAGHVRVFETSAAPEIAVEGNNTEIPDGDTSPIVGDDTDFGTQATGSTTDHTFTIKNTGAGTLNLTGSPIVAISGDSEFTIQTQPSASSIASGGADLTFVVRYAPTAAATHTATISIANDDSDENPYTFQVTGMGGDPAAALDFDGTDDFIDLGTPAALNFDNTDAFTIESWIKRIGHVDGQYNIVSNLSNKGYEFLTVSGRIYLLLRSTSGNTNRILLYNTAGGISDGNWHHVAVTYNGNSDASGVKLYIDGISQEITVVSNTLSASTTSSAPVNIGRRSGGGFPFFGELDEVRIWNDVRTCEEINFHKDCELTGTETGLVAYYQFNQGVAGGTNTGVTTLEDLTSNNHDGILNTGSNGFALTGSTSNWIAPGGVTTGNSCAAFSGAPEIVIEGGATPTEIPDGDTTPATADDTDFGTQATGSMTDHTFTIKNTGTGTLNLTGSPIVAISGDNEFTIQTQPSASSIANGGADLTFVVRYAPTATATHTATISIANDDCDENPYEFTVTGTGLPNPAVNALDFTPSGARVEIGDVNALDDLCQMTVETWVQVDAFTDRPRLVGKATSGNGNSGWELALGTNNGKVRANMGGVFVALAETTTTLNTGQWYHIAMVFDGTQTGNANRMKIYIDGVAETLTFSGSGSVPDRTNNDNHILRIGGLDASRTLDGQLDEVRIWNTALSASDINNIKDDTFSDPTTPASCLVAYYKMTDGSGTSLTDDSGNGNTGTFTNASGNIAWVASGAGVTAQTAITCPALPEIDVNETTVGTDFGNVLVGITSATKTYTITNNGTGDLDFSGLTTSDAQFAVSNFTTGTIAANGTATFDVTFTPTAAGAQSSLISIANNDCDESPYTFTVTGTGLTPEPAVHFDGTDDYVQLKDSFNPGTDDFTIETWVKRESGSFSILFAQDVSGAGPQFRLEHQGGGSLRMVAQGSGGVDILIAGGVLPLNNWAHVAYVREGVTSTFYVNGSMAAQNTAAAINNYMTNFPFRIGARGNSGAQNPFMGAMDEFRIWNDARTQTEIQNNMNCDVAQQANLVSYYRFNQGTPNGNNTGATVHDYSGNNNCGTFENFALTGTTSNYVDGPIGTCNPIAVVVPEINIQGNSTNIANGDTTPQTADDTDFGNIQLGNSDEHTFTIQNSGTDILDVDDIIITGTNSADFAISAITLPTTVAATNGSTTFKVVFTPSAVGTRVATIEIENNDCDEDPYTFQVTGTGFVPQPALHFDGTDDYILSENTMNLYGSTPTTIEFWMNTEGAVSAVDAPIGFLDGDNNNASKYYFLIHPTFGPNSWFIDNVGGYSLTSSTLPLDTWVHIAITYDGAGNLNGYINGVPADNPTHSRVFPAINGRLIIGGRSMGSSDPKWRGAVDEVRVWNDVRTQAEIQANVNCDVAQEANLVAYYRFNDGMINMDNTSSTTTSDYSGNDNCGTLNNFALTGTTSNFVDGAIGTCNVIATEPRIGTATQDVCTTFSNTVSGGGGWIDINDGSGNPIASVNAPAGVNLGTVDVRLLRASSTDTHTSGDGNTYKILSRYFHISSSNFASNANFPSSVGLRFYLTAAELAAMNNANMGTNGVTTHTASDLNITHYFGANQNCDIDDNTMTVAFVELLSPTSANFGCVDAYLEVSTTHFSEFIIHEPAAQALLPVEFMFFTAKAIDEKTQLSWQTASEINNEGFEIQWAIGTMNNEQLAMNNWESIGFVNGRGTTSEVQNYQFIHDRPANGINYYRLKQMDLNGKFEYSDIKAVRFENGQNTPVQIYPNPVKDGALTVVLDAYNDYKIQIQVYDLTGRMWLQQTSFDATTNLNVSDLAAGIYLIEIAANGQTTRQKVVIE